MICGGGGGSTFHNHCKGLGGGYRSTVHGGGRGVQVKSSISVGEGVEEESTVHSLEGAWVNSP